MKRAFLGLVGMALPHAQRATELLPELRDSWVFCANAHMSLGQRSEAIDCLRRACSLPDHLPSDADRLARLERGEEETGPRPVVAFSARGVIEPGESGLDPEQLKLALFSTRQLLERYPEDPDLLYSKVERLQVPELSAGIEAHEAAGGGDVPCVSFSSGGERWWGGFVSYERKGMSPLRIIVIVPEADMLGSLVTHARAGPQESDGHTRRHAARNRMAWGLRVISGSPA